MKIHEVRALSTDALEAKLNDTREELMKLRFQINLWRIIRLYSPALNPSNHCSAFHSSKRTPPQF